MKRLLNIQAAFALLLLAFAVGCSTMGTTGESTPLTATYQGCTATRAAVQATNAAVVAGTLKKADAEKAFVGFTAMQAGCNAAVAALQAAPPASAVTGVK